MDEQLPLHLAIRPLNLNDLDQVDQLESLCFSKTEAASRDSIKYRLSVCPELTSGLFIRTFGGRYTDSSSSTNTSTNNIKSTSSTSTSATTSNHLEVNDQYLPDDKSSIIEERLIGHIMSTKIHEENITDKDMKIPESFSNSSNRSDINEEDEEDIGHVESSFIIGLHSVAIHPDYRGKKLATLMLHDYLQKMANQQVGNLISILARPELVKFYTSMGFEDKGLSNYNHGENVWNNMHSILTPEEDKM